jgi:dihydrodipicolinate synthase/N-acetylneuraminate lyase
MRCMNSTRRLAVRALMPVEYFFMPAEKRSKSQQSALARGIVPLLDAPFDENGAIDLESSARLIEDVIEGGVHGLWAPLVASEVHTLSMEERIELATFAANAIRHRVPFVVGAFSDETGICRRFAALAEQVEAYLVAVPPALYGSSEEILGFFRAVASGISTPLVIQDLQWNGSGLDIETIHRLQDALPSLVGLKIESVPAGPKYTLVRQALGKDFYISGGWAIPHLIEALERGVDAMVPEGAMVRIFVAIYQAYSQGRRDEAVAILRRLAPVLIWSNSEICQSIAFVKRLMTRKEIFKTAGMRAPRYSWDPYTLRVADELIDYYLDLEREIVSMARPQSQD